MKGLLVKDLKLMMVQKNFFLLIVAIVIGMIIFTDDISVPLSCLTFVISLFALSTISYDEFDNGNAFLFTLPITRTGYVIEKYGFGLLLGLGAWLFATFLTIIVTVLKGTSSITDIMMVALMILPFMLIIQAIMFPFQLKFGGEKGRIAIIATIGLMAIIALIVEKGAEILFHVNIVNIINHLPTVSMGMLNAIAIMVTVVLLLISLKIGIMVVNKKEF